MKVAFDGAVLAAGPITGVGRAFLNGLAAYCEQHRGDCVLLLPERAPRPEFDVEIVPAPRGALARQWTLPGLLTRIGVTLLHSATAAVPLRARVPTIATVHDMPWHAPEPIDGGGLRARWTTGLAVRAARVVLAPSAFTAAHVLQSFGVTARVLAHAVAVPESPAAAGARGPFVVIGDDRQRKNLARTVAAHARARRECADLPELLRIGPPDAWLGERDKIAALRAARGLLHFSLWEGFGMPVAEAQAHGVPVACSMAGALPEIAGDAALLVDPHDEIAMAAAIVRLHRDEALRATLHERGRARAEERRPERIATAWRALHEELA